MLRRNVSNRRILLLMLAVASVLVARVSVAAPVAQTSEDGDHLIVSSVRVDDQATTVLGADMIYIAADDGTEIPLTNVELPDDAVMAFPALSPDGKLLAVSVTTTAMLTAEATPSSIYLMDSNGDHAEKIPGSENGSAALWSNDGRYLAFNTGTAQGDGSPAGMYYYDLNDHATHLILAVDGQNGLIGWMPDNQHLLYGTVTPDGYAFDPIYQVNIDGTEAKPLTNFHNVSAMRWSPDGSQLAVCRSIHSASQPPAIVLLKSLDDTPVKLLTFPAGSQCFLQGLVWSPDGSQIAFEELSKTGEKVTVVTAATGEVRTVRPEVRFEFFFGLDWGHPASLPAADAADAEATPNIPIKPHK